MKGQISQRDIESILNDSNMSFRNVDGVNEVKFEKTSKNQKFKGKSKIPKKKISSKS